MRTLPLHYSVALSNFYYDKGKHIIIIKKTIIKTDSFALKFTYVTL